MKTLILLLSFAAACPAVDLVLKKRTDSQIVLAPVAKGAVIRTTALTKVVLALPKPDGTEFYHTSLNADRASKSFGKSVKIDITGDAQKKLKEYYQGGRKAPLEPGKRLEPVLSLRGIELSTGNKPPQMVSATIQLPNEFEMVEDEFDFDDYQASFRLIYAPDADKEMIGKWEQWCVVQGDPGVLCQEGGEKVNKECVDRRVMCLASVEFDSASDAITFKFHRSNAWEPDMPVSFVFFAETGKATSEEPADQTTRQERLRTTAQKFSPSNRPFTFGKRTSLESAAAARDRGAKGRPRPVASVKSPITSREFPLNIAFSTSHAFAGDEDAGITAFSLQFDFNPEKVGTWAQISRGVDWRVSHMPRFSVRASNQATSDDENSVQGGWNIEIQRAFRASGVAETSFHRPPLRYAAFSIGPNFEFTKDGKNGNMLVPLEARFYLPKTIGRIQAVQGELIGGLEVGRVMSSTSNVLLSNIDPVAGATRAKISVPLDIDQNIRRFHAGARFSLNLAPTRIQEFESKLEITADYRRLGTKELYFGKAEFPGRVAGSGIAGYFKQKYGLDLAAEFAEPRTVITLREPKAEKGTRRYFNAQYQFTLKSGFGFFAGFTRGELAPAFQFVNKFETGVNFRL